MSPLEILQLIGYGMGAVLPLWLGALLVRQGRARARMERVLVALAVGIGLWHASNLVISLHAMLGLDRARWNGVLRLADTIAVVSITLSYSFLLHVHLHLWANARQRELTLTERVRVYLSYLPAIFLVVTVPLLWMGAYAPMFEKLSFFVLPFAVWACYVLVLIAATDFLISLKTKIQSEQRIMRLLALSFIVIGLLILAAIGFGMWEGTTAGLYLKTLANLGSLLPSALLAYYIYRYRFLELIIRESLIVASFAMVVLVLYLYGIRTIGAWLTARYGLRAGAVESLLILALALGAAPLRGWLEKRFHRLFEREASLYRDVVARIGTHAGQYKQLPELLRFIEQRTQAALGLQRVRILVYEKRESEDLDGEPFELSPNGDSVEAESVEGIESARWVEEVLKLSMRRDWTRLEGEEILRERGYELAFALRREEQTVGLMLVAAPREALTADALSVLEVLASQIAIAIEDCRLVEENVRLELRVAQGERLAALGQMAATIAHEVKNPLSAIKSIAQVMREDEALAREYSRDLSLIVNETDRLSRSVTQLLSFARSAPPAAARARVDELVQSFVELFRAEAGERGILLECRAETQAELNGHLAAALRDALSNLLLNAIQATPAGGRILVQASLEAEGLNIYVSDSGPGVPDNLRARIWEPFFTTKQRGTGLGLSIVRKRMEEVGGAVRLAPASDGEGALFQLQLPGKLLHTGLPPDTPTK
ncbi:MAG TPA: ATP-binding protein [Pyrinomonadaceae bacterium]|jgi:signal transduction histidine kinase